MRRCVFGPHRSACAHSTTTCHLPSAIVGREVSIGVANVSQIHMVSRLSLLQNSGWLILHSLWLELALHSYQTLVLIWLHEQSTHTHTHVRNHTRTHRSWFDWQVFVWQLTRHSIFSSSVHSLLLVSSRNWDGNNCKVFTWRLLVVMLSMVEWCRWN